MPYHNGWAATHHNFLLITTPDLLKDSANGRMPSRSQFLEYVKFTNMRLDAVREAREALAPTTAPVAVTPPAPALKLVPVPDVKDLQRQVEAHAASAERAWRLVNDLCQILASLNELASSGDGETLSALVDVVRQK